MKQLRDLMADKSRWILALAGLAAAISMTGCAHTDDEALSERPWNAPKTWETGVPQSMMQGR
jgi:hypothetical protein